MKKIFSSLQPGDKLYFENNREEIVLRVVNKDGKVVITTTEGYYTFDANASCSIFPCIVCTTKEAVEKVVDIFNITVGIV